MLFREVLAKASEKRKEWDRRSELEQIIKDQENFEAKRLSAVNFTGLVDVGSYIDTLNAKALSDMAALLKAVTKIQANFRGRLLRLIYKMELMNKRTVEMMGKTKKGKTTRKPTDLSPPSSMPTLSRVNSAMASQPVTGLATIDEERREPMTTPSASSQRGGGGFGAFFSSVGGKLQRQTTRMHSR
eukprot:TRINITY_DN4982_c0_g1_i2.p1 TRINITY_DN4982_c0_g1~~TRINITY_DN4982_c0_g1_i2.p1  ORF type:complete len:186 (-),score=19.55 TRINITY_DN4982_c0_g1_i2:317-874(-)